MKETVSSTLTKGSQITISVRAQRALGIKPGDRVMVTTDGNILTVRPQKYSLQDVIGSVKHPSGTDPGDFDQVIDDAQQAGLAASPSDTPHL